MRKSPEAIAERKWSRETPTFDDRGSEDLSGSSSEQASEAISGNGERGDSRDTDMSESLTDAAMGSYQTSPGLVDASSQSAQKSSDPDHSDNVQELCAKSRRPGFTPPLPRSEEWEVIDEFMVLKGYHHAPRPSNHGAAEDSEPENMEYIEFELSDFEIYLPREDNLQNSSGLRGLEYLHARVAHSSYLFDGILSTADARCYVQGVPFETCSIGNYGKENHSVDSNIWIQSNVNRESNIWYLLKSPSREYFRFHEKFLWLADLAKHFVDYSQASDGAVSIRDFRSSFSEWLQLVHTESIEFQNWYQEYGNDDFRVPVVRNIAFLYKESLGVNEGLISMPIWSEILELDAIPRQKIEVEETVVTPYVYECFKELRFGHLLKPVEAIDVTATQQRLHGEMFHLSGNKNIPGLESNFGQKSNPPLKVLNTSKNDAKARAEHTNNISIEREKMIGAIKCGDVLSVVIDGRGSKWKNEVSRYKMADDCWYVCVQKIYTSPANQRSFDVIWLYRASDTHCAKMKYPFPNELFLSANCTCSGQKIEEDEIFDAVNVIWHGTPSSSSQELFIRQTYIDNERFVTLKDEHKSCKHSRSIHGLQGSSIDQRLPIGQTVLAPPQHKSKYDLEAYEIVEYVAKGSKQMAILRHLKRRHEIDGKGRPNELVYTEKTDSVEIEKIARTCLVRFYSEFDVAKKLVPPPYCRDGTGNAFYITSKLIEVNGPYKLQSFDGDAPTTLLQGFDPSRPSDRRKLRGMDLYCGGGNFGRGLEEGGALHNEWAVDINNLACHTYLANIVDPAATKIFNGSVNDLLSQALRGNPNKSELIPLPGDVEFISAGSPCQGFSSANAKKNSHKGLRNQSLIASVCAYIDFYRPRYGLLENVVGMAQKGAGRDEDVLSQLICAIVGMGYQLEVFLLDTWSCGSPQSRARLFVCFAAPGLEAPKHPGLSHSHPPKAKARDLGKLANDESFGGRIHAPAPFKFVNAKEGTADLPGIGDGAVSPTEFPEHIIISKISQQFKDQFSIIPKNPKGMNLSKALERGIVTWEQRQKLFGHMLRNCRGELRESFTPLSRAYGRVNPNDVFPIVVVRQSHADARQGNCIHWDEDRLISLLEAKRAQSFPDEEILLGSPTECWKLLGNSVARTVALSLGLVLREAWLRSDIDALFPAGKDSSSTCKQMGSNRFEASEASLRSEPFHPHKARRSGQVSSLASTTNTFRFHTPISTATENRDRGDRISRQANPHKARSSIPTARYASSAYSISDLAASLMDSAFREIKISSPVAISSKKIKKIDIQKSSEKYLTAVVNSDTTSYPIKAHRKEKWNNAGSVPTNPAPNRQIYEIPDSTAFSDDESEISEKTFSQFMTSFSKKTPETTAKQGTALSKTDTASDNISPKRSFDMVQVSEAGESERSRKIQRTVPLSPKQPLATKQSECIFVKRTQAVLPQKTIAASKTTKSCIAIPNNRHQHPKIKERVYIRNGQDIDDDSDEDDILARDDTPESIDVNKFISNNMHQHPRSVQRALNKNARNVDSDSDMDDILARDETLELNRSSAGHSLPTALQQFNNRTQARALKTPSTGVHKSPTKPKPRPKSKSLLKGLPVIIDLITDGKSSSFEDENGCETIRPVNILPSQLVNLLSDDEDGEGKDGRRGSEKRQRITTAPSTGLISQYSSTQQKPSATQRPTMNMPILPGSPGPKLGPSEQGLVPQRSAMHQKSPPALSQTAPERYVPVKNRDFAAYWQTHRFMGPKHVRKRGKGVA
jgi:DNA (cytosine-5)-methyltransferase 1